MKEGDRRPAKNNIELPKEAFMDERGTCRFKFPHF